LTEEKRHHNIKSLPSEFVQSISSNYNFCVIITNIHLSFIGIYYLL